MKEKPKTNNFNAVAWCYEGLSWIVFGKKLRRSQQLLLTYVNEGDKILLLGGGTGWILSDILQLKKECQIDYVEVSEEMIRKAKKVVDRYPEARVHFIHGDEQYIKTQEQYDCVMTFYFFDLFLEERQQKIVSMLQPSIRKGGKLLVADFYLSSSSPFWNKILIKTMYLFFKITCKIEADKLYPFRNYFQQNFLSQIFSASSLSGFIRSEVYIKE